LDFGLRERQKKTVEFESCILDPTIENLKSKIVRGGFMNHQRNDHWSRREFLSTVGLAGTAALLGLQRELLAAEAQQTGKVHRIGVLVTTSRSAQAGNIKAFQQGLRELGYIEGKNIIIEYRYADGRMDTLPELAGELVRLKVDVIVSNSAAAIQAVENPSKTIPFIFAAITSDPVEDGLVSSMARPGGNVTGFTIFAPELNGKRLDLLKETFPKITRVGLIRRAGSPRLEQGFKEDETVAKRLGFRLQSILVKGADDLESAFNAAKNAGVQALTFPPSTFLSTNRTRFIELTAKIRLPAIYPGTAYVEAGGLMSYGPDNSDNWRRAAGYVDKILKGAKAGDLPVQQPMRFEFVINLKTAKQIGVTIPPNVLVRADKVIR
jgi:putative ABC transport system substrate-binding protein